jgi:hypothetical protein
MRSASVHGIEAIGRLLRNRSNSGIEFQFQSLQDHECQGPSARDLNRREGNMIQQYDDRHYGEVGRKGMKSKRVVLLRCYRVLGGSERLDWSMY